MMSPAYRVELLKFRRARVPAVATVVILLAPPLLAWAIAPQSNPVTLSSPCSKVLGSTFRIRVYRGTGSRPLRVKTIA